MNLKDIAAGFRFFGTVESIEPHGNGHINDTYLVVCRDGEAVHQYIMQRLNTRIFPNYQGLMRNIETVTDYLRDIIRSQGGDCLRECMTPIRTIDGATYQIVNRDCWRAYLFIDNTVAYQIADDKNIFADSGRAFGRFIARLDGFDASGLCEVIENFHNTKDRYAKFCASLQADPLGRSASAQEEIAFVTQRNAYCGKIVDALSRGEIPLRVTHNDTKLNNVLIDKTSGKAICVIDLDTIMPGSLLYDFGDSVRFGCSTALEDEQDLSKVDFDLSLYEAYCEGFLDGIGDKITTAELDMLHIGSILMTYECGMRFLTDYLDGDLYFKTAYPEHNLVRARTQFKLVGRMEACSEKMIEIAHKYCVRKK